MYYGIREEKQHFIDNTFLVYLLKIWNGRRSRYLKYCDKKVMKYIITNMCTNRHLFVKYDSPLSLLKDYFVPSLMKTYRERIKTNPKELQRLLSQSWTRIRQMYIGNLVIDIKTGEKIPQSGILAMYMKAKKEKLSISAPTVSKLGDENEPTFAEYSTTSNRDEIINSSTEFITMNPMPKYPLELINQLNRETKVSIKTIDTILHGVHNHNYHDLIRDIYAIILSRTNVNIKNDVCTPNYNILVKRNIISSKNNPDSKKMQTIANMLLDKIFQEKLSIDYHKYSNVQQIQLRNVIVQGLVYNMKQNICKGQVTG